MSYYIMKPIKLTISIVVTLILILPSHASSCGKTYSPLMAGITLHDLVEKQVNPEKLEKFLRCNAKSLSQIKLQKTFDHAVYVGHTRNLAVLLKYGATIKKAGTNNSLLVALEEGHSDTAAFLVKNGARINKNDRILPTALTLAILKQEKELIRFLLDLGADPNARDKRYNLPITAAVQSGNIELVKYLIAKGAKLNVWTPVSYFAVNPVRLAAITNNTEILGALVKAGAKLDWIPAKARKRGYQTALVWAVRRKNPEMIRLLLLHGASIPIANETLKETSESVYSLAFEDSELGDGANNLRTFQALLDACPALHAWKKTNLGKPYQCKQNSNANDLFNFLRRSRAKNNRPAIKALREHGIY